MLEKIFPWRKKFSIEMAKGAEDLMMATMLEDILKTNLEGNFKKIAAFRKLKGIVGLDISDVEMKIGLKFSCGKLTILPDIPANAKVRITSDSQTVTLLSTVKTKYGMPWYFDETGKEILKAALDGKFKVSGAVLHLPTLVRLSKVMSVH